MNYDSDNDDNLYEPDFTVSHNIHSIWHNLKPCHCNDTEDSNQGCAHLGKNINVDQYVEYCKTTDQYVIGKDWNRRKVYGYNFEFKLKSNNKIYKLNTDLAMQYLFENKWHWSPLILSFEILCDNIILEKKTYDFISNDSELIDDLTEYQLVARSICYYDGLPFKSNK